MNLGMLVIIIFAAISCGLMIFVGVLIHMRSKHSILLDNANAEIEDLKDIRRTLLDELRVLRPLKEKVGEMSAEISNANRVVGILRSDKDALSSRFAHLREDHSKLNQAFANLQREFELYRAIEGLEDAPPSSTGSAPHTKLEQVW